VKWEDLDNMYVKLKKGTRNKAWLGLPEGSETESATLMSLDWLLATLMSLDWVPGPATLMSMVGEHPALDS
jgi:hypothetical protein